MIIILIRGGRYYRFHPSPHHAYKTQEECKRKKRNIFSCFASLLGSPRLSAERVVGRAAPDLVGGVLDAAVAEGGVLLLLDGLEDGLEDGDLAGDAEHALLLEPELLLGLPQQRREGTVLEVLHGDHEPLHRGAHAHGQVALGRRRRGARGRAVREGQRPLQELLGLALAGIAAAAAAVGVGAGAGGGRAGVLGGDRELAPLLEHLLHAHDLGDLVRLLGAWLLHLRFFDLLATNFVGAAEIMVGLGGVPNGFRCDAVDLVVVELCGADGGGDLKAGGGCGSQRRLSSSSGSHLEFNFLCVFFFWLYLSISSS